MLNAKKKYLNSYLFQQSKIERLKEMSVINPELKNHYNRQIDIAKSVRHNIEDKISEIDNDIFSEVLFQKYILGKTLEEISLTINYSKRQTERLHIKALEKFKM